MSDLALMVENLWSSINHLKKAEKFAEDGRLEGDELLALQQARATLEAISEKYKGETVKTDKPVTTMPPLRYKH